MTAKGKTILDSRESSQPFLFSKTDTGRIRPEKRKTIVGTNEVLKSAFPDMLVGSRFIKYALSRLDVTEKFAAMVMRLDQAGPNDEKHAITKINNEIVGVAEILNSTCQIENGIWGVLEPGLFGSFFPGKNGPQNLKIARNVQKRLKDKTNQTVTIGVATYPSITYTKSEIVDNAFKALEHASFFGPDSAVVFDAVSLNISGDKLYEEGKIKEATDELIKALLLEPSNVNVHNSLGVCYSLLGSYEPAIDEFKAAISLDSDEHMAYFNLGLVYMLTERRDQALEFFLKANEINSDVYEVAFQTGKLYLESGNSEKSKPFLEHAAALKPESSTVSRCLGDCYAAVNMPDNAISAYKKAIKQNPHDSAALSALGYLYGNQGENPEIALMFCRESVALSPGNGLFRYRLGRLYSNQNRHDDALVEYKKAKQFGFDAARDIQEIKDRLAKESF